MKIEFEIKIPKTLSDFRIKHYKALQDPMLGIGSNYDSKIVFLSNLTSTGINKLRMLTNDQVDYLYSTVLLAFDKFEIASEPCKEIEINGIKYYRINPFKIGQGWHEDFKRCDINKDPVRLACLFYHPIGFKYGEVDDNDNLINPISSRYEDFKEHFPLTLFIESCGFFLTEYAKLMKIYTVKLKVQMMMKKILKKMRLTNSRRQ